MYTNSPRYSHMTFGHLFANRSLSEDDEIYPLTVSEIAEEQHLDPNLQNTLTLGAGDTRSNLLKKLKCSVKTENSSSQRLYNYVVLLGTIIGCNIQVIPDLKRLYVRR